VVNRPAAQVSAYATDPARFREWQQGRQAQKEMPASVEALKRRVEAQKPPRPA